MATDPHLSARALDIVEWSAKVVIALGSIMVFISRIYKPFTVWRHEHSATLIRSVLAPELTALQRIIDQDVRYTSRITEAREHTRLMFAEFDEVLEVLLDNRERLDETNGLLDELGFTSDRRVNEDRRQEVQMMVTRLAERRKSRQRSMLSEVDERGNN